MRKLVLLLAFGFLLFGASPPTWAQGSFPLEYKMVKGFTFDDPLVSMGSQYLQRSPGRPADLKGTPEAAKGELSWFMGGAGDKQLVVAVDSATPANLFVDTNGNGDLSDEKPLKRAKMTNSPWGNDGFVYGPAAIKAAGAAEGLVGRVMFARPSDDYMMAFPGGYLTGQAQLGGKTYKIALVDSNYDGQFEPTRDPSRASMRRGGGDTLAVDIDGNGRFEYNPYEQIEVQPLTGMVKLGPSYYSVKVATDGSTMELVKAEPKMGTLAVKGANVELMVLGTSGPQILKGKEGKWELPEGRYTCQSVSLVSVDDKKAKWVLRAMGRTGKLQDFEIKVGETLTVEMGAPLTVKADVQQAQSDWLFKGKTVSLGFTMVGVGGEEYFAGAEKNGTRVPAPKVTIYDASDKLLATGDFAYG